MKFYFLQFPQFSSYSLIDFLFYNIQAAFAKIYCLTMELSLFIIAPFMPLKKSLLCNF